MPGKQITMLLTPLAALAALVPATGCGDFETVSIVLDLRVLSMRGEPPEVLVPFDPSELPSSPDQLELAPVDVCALVADPNDDRSLDYSMNACAVTDSLRCDEPGSAVVPLVSDRTVADPERADAPIEVCGTVEPLLLFEVVQEALEGDSLSGFGGINVLVDLAVRGAGEPVDNAVWAAKRIVYAPLDPPERKANQNPILDQLRIVRDGRNEDESVAAPFGRCSDIGEPFPVTRGELLTFAPVENEQSREDYVVPTFDGGVRMFTENHTYNWFATTGEWSPEFTGGPRDLAGNEPDLDSEWTAPDDPEEIGDGLDVSVWVVQRDERGGQSWYETCLRVTP
ncbi:MAG: hypothetical protein AAGC55_10590 [Myxococcota bacterium]